MGLGLSSKNAEILRRDPFQFNTGLFSADFHPADAYTRGIEAGVEGGLGGLQQAQIARANLFGDRAPTAGARTMAMGERTLRGIDPGLMSGAGADLLSRGNIDPRLAVGAGLFGGDPGGTALGVSDQFLQQLQGFDPFSAAETQFNKLDAILEPGRAQARSGTAAGLLASGRLGSTAGARTQGELESAIERERQQLLTDQFGQAMGVQGQMADIAAGTGALGLQGRESAFGLGSQMLSSAQQDELARLGAGAELQRGAGAFGMDLSQLGMAQRQAMQQASAGELAGALGIDSQMLANIQAMAGVSAPAGSVAPQEGAGAKALTAFVGELGGALGEGMKWSDRRLKTNIKQVGMHPVGVPRYKFDYIWGESSSGVMAQDLLDVMPEAILRVGDFYAVNYDMIGGH